MNQFTQEQVKEKMYRTCGDEYSLVGEYKTSYMSVRVRHNNEACNNFEWETVPKNTFLKKKLTCPKCAGRLSFLQRDEFLTKKRIQQLLAPDYEVLDNLRGRRDLAVSIIHKSETCNNHILYASPNSIVSHIADGKILCPVCAHIDKVTTRKQKKRGSEEK